MVKQACEICSKPKAPNECALCHIHICKNCVQFLPEETFSFLSHVPKNLKFQVYCLSCFNQEVEVFLNKYNETLEKAKEVMVFTKSQAKETRFIKRLEDPIVISQCADKDELILRIAFIAAKKNFNSIIDLELKPEKVRDGAYHTHLWSGSAIPAQVTDDKLMKDRSFWSTPN